WFPADAWALSRARPVYETVPGFAEEIRAARALADLPRNARRYLERVEEAAQAPVRFVSVGPDREETIAL
ncbi:MAG: adenylosuccinate synthase, partial [Planctomycetota bacterium]